MNTFIAWLSMHVNMDMPAYAKAHKHHSAPHHATPHHHSSPSTTGGGGSGTDYGHANGNTIVYPDFEVKNKVPAFKGKILASFYTQPGVNPGHDAVNFYQAFSNYLNTSAVWQTLFRMIGGGLAAILWYIANVLSWFYVHMFSLLSIHTLRIHADKYHEGVNSPYYFHVHQLFEWANTFGLAIFGLLLICYAIGTIINSPSFQRWKNIFRNAILITFFLFCLPWCTSMLAQGVQSVASNMFGDDGITDTTKIGDSQDYLPTRAVSSSIISVPEYIEHVAPGSPVPGLTPSDKVYSLQDKHGSVGTPGVNAPVFYIDMDRMDADQQNKWNGIRSETVPSLLHSLGSNNEIMNKNSLESYSSDAAQIMHKPNGAGHEQYVRNSRNPWNSDSSHYMSIHTGNLFHDAMDAGGNTVNMANPWIWGEQIYGAIAAHMTQSSYADNYKQLFSMDYGHAGPGIGNNPAEQGLTSHKMKTLSATNDYEDSNPTSKLFVRGYDYYHVNWLSMFGQLIMLVLIIGSYIFKLFLLIFKLSVMYISSGILLYRNADNYQRIKNWMRDLFSIYEAALMDIIMCYIALQLVFPAYHDFTTSLLLKTQNAYLVNPWTVAVIDIIGDCALWVGSIKGLNAVNAAIGSTGGGANSGGSGLFGSMIAMRAANTVMGTGRQVAGFAGRQAVGAGAGLLKKGKGYLHPKAETPDNKKHNPFGKRGAVDNAAKDKTNGKESPTATGQRKHGQGGLNNNNGSGSSNRANNPSSAITNVHGSGTHGALTSTDKSADTNHSDETGNSKTDNASSVSLQNAESDEAPDSGLDDSDESTEAGSAEPEAPEGSDYASDADNDADESSEASITAGSNDTADRSEASSALNSNADGLSSTSRNGHDSSMQSADLNRSNASSALNSNADGLSRTNRNGQDSAMQSADLNRSNAGGIHGDAIQNSNHFARPRTDASHDSGYNTVSNTATKSGAYTASGLGAKPGHTSGQGLGQNVVANRPGDMNNDQGAGNAGDTYYGSGDNENNTANFTNNDASQPFTGNYSQNTGINNGISKDVHRNAQQGQQFKFTGKQFTHHNWTPSSNWQPNNVPYSSNVNLGNGFTPDKNVTVKKYVDDNKPGGKQINFETHYEHHKRH